MPTLYIMRHGKAENTSPDIHRHLSQQGQEDVLAMAKQLAAKNIKINHVVYSPAARAKETALLMCDGLNIASEQQFEDKRIYNAPLSVLQTVLSEVDESLETVLLVGHNPGLADLILSLTEQSVGLSAGNVAVVAAETWKDVRACRCNFIKKF